MTTKSAVLPPAEYYATLPHHLASAGLIIHDLLGRVLLVQPTYQSVTWEIPGGGLDAGEFPWQSAQREAKEELGVDLLPGRLLAIDWVPPQPDGRPALSNFVFDGGRMTADLERTIHLPCDELGTWRMWGPDEWDTLLAPHMARRIRACMAALATGSTAYLQYGWAPEHPAA